MILVSSFSTWNLSYPIGDDSLDSGTLCIRGRTTSGAGQFELAGAEYLADGSQIRARDIIDYDIGFKFMQLGSLREIQISERYPINEVGGKVRVGIQSDKDIRPNIGNLFAALFLLPEVSQIGKSLPSQGGQMLDKTYWIDAVGVSVVCNDEEVYTLSPTAFILASSNKDDNNQFSGAVRFNFQERLTQLYAVCQLGIEIAAGGLPAALKYYLDVFEGRTAFSYATGAIMRKVISDYLENCDSAKYQHGEDLLPALQELVRLNTRVVHASDCRGQSIEITEPHNLVFFGAPGTGKSYQLAKLAEKYFAKEDIYRVSFHPDYTYAQFAGCYKPTEVERIKADEDDDIISTEITYDFVPGPFLETYIKAVQNQDTNYLLVVEEINRANVAAVFGDIFQLLDRDGGGRSEYAISVPIEMRKFFRLKLQEYVNSAIIPDSECLLREQMRVGLESGRLSLPPNLYIWATMNSADQGVYPMDTAFKRRWDFRYIGINEGSSVIDKYNVPIGNPPRMIKWDMFRRGINEVLLNAGVNEDKLLGPFFIQPSRLSDPAGFTQVFMNKVLLYLFEDAAKTKKAKVFQGEDVITFSTICRDFVDLGELVFKGIRQLDSVIPDVDRSVEELDSVDGGIDSEE